MQTTVTVRGQTAVPAKIRRRHNIRKQTRLEWIDDGEVITVIPINGDPVKSARGILKGKGLTKSLLRTRVEERKLNGKR